MPGVLQSPLLNRIGGSTRVRDDLAHALEVGRKVTAKVQWLSKTAPKSRARWIHCTPLLGVNDAIGVWMVILVDDEDEAEIEIEHQEVDPRDSGRLGSNYTADPLPWDAGRQRHAAMGVSTSIWSEHDGHQAAPAETMKPEPTRPLFRQSSDTGEFGRSPSVVRPGPKIAGRAYSYTSTTDGQITADGSNSMSGGRSSPSSSGSGILTPMQSSMQPKVRIAGQQSIDEDTARRPPVNMPYRNSVDSTESGSRPVRRTYKSLSPYGILFED